MRRYITVGIDEVGRGPLAGPVIASAVIFPHNVSIVGLADSKQLTAKKRENFYMIIQEKALDWAIGRAEVEEIDEINILQASLLAMQRAVANLKIIPDLALVDGHIAPKLPCKVTPIIRGDETVPIISAASIMAKVTRDREMCEWHQHYPHYNFINNKGYPTAQHLLAIKQHGITPIHRRSFAPVANYLANENI
jgi:ribonuclease HII